MKKQNKNNNLNVVKSPENYKYLGKKFPLKDSFQKVQGKVSYAGDLNFHESLHIRLVVSPHAHARIISINLN